ncbi:MAG: DUF3419 family protein [Bacilli bacterium]|nr:DUF3419 family protein [Bacilli bacterium]
MERFNSIYPFTTENIAGYMKDLDLTGKKIITVTGSSDHIINAILKGCRDITTFDINPLTKYYMDLKLKCIEKLSFNDFLDIFLYNTKNIDREFIERLNIDEESKNFWINNLEKYSNNWQSLRKSNIFNNKYFNPKSKFYENLYLEESSYNIVANNIKNTKIKFINKNLIDLDITENYDYMFLSNISDYLDKIYLSVNYLECYHELLLEFSKHIKIIYFAYLYDIGNTSPRSQIDNLKLVDNIFKNYDKIEIKSALEHEKNKKDGVLILGRK